MGLLCLSRPNMASGSPIFKGTPSEISFLMAIFEKWHGQQGSNLRPAVLETAALPTELCPYRARMSAQQALPKSFRTLCKEWFASKRLQVRRCLGLCVGRNLRGTIPRSRRRVADHGAGQRVDRMRCRCQPRLQKSIPDKWARNLSAAAHDDKARGRAVSRRRFPCLGDKSGRHRHKDRGQPDKPALSQNAR